MHPSQKYLPNHWNDWIQEYCLAESGGKYKTLGARHFTGVLGISFADDSVAEFNGAFAVKDEAREELVVFTEHCGYHVFNLHAISALKDGAGEPVAPLVVGPSR